MALNETTVTVIGTILGDVVHSRDGEGEGVAFWLRSTERRFDKASRTYVEGRRLSVRVKCKRRLATGVQSALHKGDPVIVTGRLSTSEHVGGNGEALAVPEVEAFAVGPNLAACAAFVHRARRSEPMPADARAPGDESSSVAGKALVEPPEPVPVG